jgi:hypothetical protein
MLIQLEFNDFNLRQSCYFSIHLIYMLILACSFLGFFFLFLYIYTPPWQRMVIKTKSVKYMPFYLSLANFTNGLIWVIYGLLDFDINLVVCHHRTETNFCFFFFHANYLQLTMKRLSVDLLTASQWLGCVIWADSAHTLWNLLQIDQIGWWW